MRSVLSDERALAVTRETAKLLRELDAIERRLARLEHNVRAVIEEIEGLPPCNLILVPAND